MTLLSVISIVYQIYVLGIELRGPDADSCGTPLLTCASLDVVPLAATNCCLFARNLCIHAATLPLIPFFEACSVICRGRLYQKLLQNLVR